MGVDISGFVEVRPRAIRTDLPDEIEWEAAVGLDRLSTTRDYDSFGCLFGVTNYAGFRPVSAERGLPSDVSAQVHQAYEHDDHRGLWPTWIGWDEIEEIDWNEPAEHADARLHRYERGEDGQWTCTRKAAWSAEAFMVQKAPVPSPTTDPTIWPDGSVWTDDDVQFRAVTLTRRDAVPEDGPWRPVWEAMSGLARLHGPANCRLVVWFDR